jgi:hypothetical protein
MYSRHVSEPKGGNLNQLGNDLKMPVGKQRLVLLSLHESHSVSTACVLKVSN